VAVARTDASDAIAARGPAAVPPHRDFAWLDPGDAGADTTALIAAVRARRFDAAVVLRDRPDGAWVADLVTRREPPRWVRDLREHLSVAARQERARSMGIDSARLAALDDTVTLRSHVALGSRTGSRRADFLVTFGVLMLLVSVLLTSMSYIMIGISGEKQARVSEVIMSAIPAQAWMDGKIVAFTVIGLLTGVVWTLSLLVLAGPLAFQIPDSVNAANLAITTLFAVLGLYLYNAFICALFSSAQNMQSASRWQGNFVLLPFLPVFFLVGLLENPDAPAMMALSHVPFFSPSMIPARLVIGALQPWEIPVALVVLVGSSWLMRIFAGRVFRLGMLMYGKDMTLPELIRWARVR
jgi:ABC-2 type transport system permease protein